MQEVVIQTKTRTAMVGKRERKAVTAERVFSLDTLASNADILSRCGGQAVLVFRSIIGSYWMSNPEQRRTWFKTHPTFRAAIQIGDRQFQRAAQNLERAGYIERKIVPGRKMRLRLTELGKQALAKTPPEC